MRALVIAVAAGLVATVVVVLLLDADTSTGPSRGEVTVLGDSLDVGTAPYLASELAGWSVDDHSVIGRTTEQGLRDLRAIVRVAPVVVVSLGTNDIPPDAALFRREVDELMRLAGPGRCVVWSTIWLDGPVEPLNDVLRDGAVRHRNLELVDWASMVSSEPKLLSSDSVHGTPVGYAKRAEEVARVARRCYPADAVPLGLRVARTMA